MAESESRAETLFWTRAAESLEIVAQARAELANGDGVSEEQIRAQFEVPKRGT